MHKENLLALRVADIVSRVALQGHFIAHIFLLKKSNMYCLDSGSVCTLEHTYQPSREMTYDPGIQGF